MFKRLIATIAFVYIISNCFAELLSVDTTSDNLSYKLMVINEDNGFIQNSVLDIKQDKLGYMWYATPNGIYRHDGYNFKIYYNEPNDINTIKGNFITDISEWFDDELCFSKGNTLNVFDPQRENFYRVDTSKSSGNFSIIDLAIDKHNPNILWLLSENQILILKLSDDHHVVESVLETSSSSYKQMYGDKNGYVWLLSEEEIACCRYDVNDGIIKLFTQKISGASKILQNASDQIAVYSLGKLTVIQFDQEYERFQTTEFELNHNQNSVTLDDILIQPDGDIIGVDWDRGIYNIDIKNRKINYAPIASDGNFNKLFRYNVCYLDNSCVLWIGTRHGGLYKINLERKEFNSIDKQSELTYTNQITGDNAGNIYIGTHYRGIKHININNSRLSNKDINSELGISNSESIFAVDFYDNYLWYATTKGELWRAKCSIHGEVTSKEFITNVTAGLGFFNRGESGRLYYALFAQVGGAQAYQVSDKIESIYFCDNSSSAKPHFHAISTICKFTNYIGGVASILEDGDDAILVGSADMGLFRIALDGSQEIENIELPSDIAQNNIFSLHKDSMGRLYVGTFGGGLVVIEGEDRDNYSYYTRSNGLANNAIYSIEDGGDGSLWISTDEGLSRYDINNHIFHNYDTTDGILSTNFRKWSSWRSPDGHLFFGGVRGVNYFESDRIKENTYLPEIRITNLRVGGKETEYVAYTYSSDGGKPTKQRCLTLAPNENDLRFEFASLHFENPHKNQYQYMLRGVDQDWVNASSDSRSVTYSNLSHGTYEFIVRGTNSDGIWSTDYAGLSFTIQPYWWQTWYAKAIYMLIMIALGYMLYIFVSQRNRHKLDNRLNQAKLDFFTNISHEIKTPLTIISGLLDLNSSKGDGITSKDLEIVRRNNKRMLALVTQLLDFRKVTQGHMPFSPIQGDIVPLLEGISENFMSLALKNGVEYSFENRLTSREIMFEADKIEKIVANLLSNAFKYTPQSGGVIELSLRMGLPDILPSHIAKTIKQDSEFYTTIAVKDNGDGIAPEHIDKIFDRFYQAGKYDPSLKNRGIGVGLAYSKILTELHEGYLYVDSIYGEGSTFFVILPERLNRGKHNAIATESTNHTSVEFLLEPKAVANNTVAEINEPLTQKELLIVEDNQEIREFLREVLSPIYIIHEAANGLEGLEIAERLIPDIIVSDVMMPHMDGITLCNKLKTNEKTDHIPIILLTANSTIDHRVEGIRSGADSYIPKPFNLEHLKVRIEKLLEIRTVLKNKYMQQSGLVDLQQIDINSIDKEFLASVEQTIEANLDDSEFTVERLEEAMKYSHMQLYRKIKSISGVSVVEFIRNYRLKRAVDMMRQGHTRINEIVYSVGFATPSYFSKSFKKRYGKSPIEFIDELRNR